MSTRVRSFCKINLGLAVGPARADRFHDLTTVYQTLALHDLVTVDAEPAERTRIVLETNHPAVPCTARGDCERNTAYRMVAGALTRMGRTAQVRIRIEKQLPVQGGLGAGSANAAAALLGLEAELAASLPVAERLTLAAEIGSDVPLFLLGGTVLGLNRGEAVYPLPDSPGLPVVVAVPPVGVSTSQAFRDLDKRALGSDPGGSGLTSSGDPDRLGKLSRVFASVWTHTGVGRAPTGIVSHPSIELASSGALPQRSGEAEGDLAGNPLLALVRTGVENDFEEVAFRQHPSLRDLKRALDGTSGSSDTGASGALYAALSGSGSALFGIYEDLQAAREAQQRVESLRVKALLTETLDRRGYWERMFA